MKRLVQIIFLAFLVVGLSAITFAQDSDNISGEAEVLAAMNVTGVTNLDFGDVSPTSGENVTVNANGTGNDAGTTVGSFTVSGSSDASVQLEFTTLEDLTLNGEESSSDETLTIDYASSDYALWSNNNDNSSGTNFNPDSPTSATLDGNDGEIYVFIGGQAQPKDNQVGGTYTGTITLTATYN